MRRIIWAVLAFSAFAASAHAQTTTRCRQTYAGAPELGVTCQTDAPASGGVRRTPAPDPVYHWQDVPTTPCKSWVESKGGNYCEARQIAANRKAVGELMGSGRCDEALKAALATGDIGLAREVRDFCAGK